MKTATWKWGKCMRSRKAETDSCTLVQGPGAPALNSNFSGEWLSIYGRPSTCRRQWLSWMLMEGNRCNMMRKHLREERACKWASEGTLSFSKWVKHRPGREGQPEVERWCAHNQKTQLFLGGVKALFSSNEETSKALCLDWVWIPQQGADCRRKGKNQKVEKPDRTRW